NLKKLIIIREINDVDYCLVEHNIIWKMNYYRNSATYDIRKILFNEDKIYWNDYFIKDFGKSIY
ncbi:hypothetical protein OAJ57_03020, partial [Alphaproteobacteria bacterium]|nr:hypothetical protein [Alphaproteobacteria bacterium]